MKLAAMGLRQRDGVSCGPAVAVLAGALLDPSYARNLTARATWPGGRGSTQSRAGCTPPQTGSGRARSARRRGHGRPPSARTVPGTACGTAGGSCAGATRSPTSSGGDGALAGGDAGRQLHPAALGADRRRARPDAAAATSRRRARCGRCRGTRSGPRGSTGLGFPRAFALVLPRYRVPERNRTYDRTVGELQSIGYHGQPVQQAFRRVDPPVAVLVDLAAVFPARAAPRGRLQPRRPADARRRRRAAELLGPVRAGLLVGAGDLRDRLRRPTASPSPTGSRPGRCRRKARAAGRRVESWLASSPPPTPSTSPRTARLRPAPTPHGADHLPRRRLAAELAGHRRRGRRRAGS